MTHDDVRELAAAFVLGALTPDEDAAVCAHLAGCDEGHPEIDELGGAAQALALGVQPVEPPAGLRRAIVEAAAREPGRAPIAFPARADAAGRDRGLRRASPAIWLLRAAAVVAIVVLVGADVLLAQQLGAARDYESAVAAVLQEAAQPGAQAALIRPAPGQASGPQGLAAISAAGQVTVAMRNLAPTGATDVYEAWAIPPGGAPEPLGSFQVGSSGTGSLRAAQGPAVGGVTIALTHEPGPGATTPTLPILSLGTASAPPSS